MRHVERWEFLRVNNLKTFFKNGLIASARKLNCRTDKKKNIRYTARRLSIRIGLFYFKRQRDLFDGLEAKEARALADQSDVSVIKAGNLNKK